VSNIFLLRLTINSFSLSRAHVIENVPFLDKNMVERLLERTRDIDKEVRCCAWRKLKDLNFWKLTSVPQLLTLFLQGLKDKYECIKLVWSNINSLKQRWFCCDRSGTSY
jgi:hypothetical protein